MIPRFWRLWVQLFAVLLVLLLCVRYAAGFLDVPPDRFYSEAVQWAEQNGITTGTSETTFEPDRPVTRGEVVTFLYRMYLADLQPVNLTHPCQRHIDTLPPVLAPDVLGYELTCDEAHPVAFPLAEYDTVLAYYVSYPPRIHVGFDLPVSITENVMLHEVGHHVSITLYQLAPEDPEAWAQCFADHVQYGTCDLGEDAWVLDHLGV